MEGIVREVRLIAIRESTYTNYVFKDLENDEFIMCTRLPNWQVPDININDEGFLQYKFVKAGEEYFTPDGSKHIYKYTNSYFINFILNNNTIKEDKIIL